MMKFILILTFLSSSGTGGAGGLSMTEFNSKESCENAGQLWFDTSIKKLGYSAKLNSSFICVEK